MNARGQYGTYRVGAVAVPQEQLAQTDDEFRQLNLEIADARAALAATGLLTARSPLDVFYHNTWVPLYESWRRFDDASKVVVGPAAWHASALFDTLRSKLVDARVQAHLLMQAATSPSSEIRPVAVTPPVAPPIAPSVPEDKGFFHSALGIGAIAAFAIAGVAAVVSLARHAEAS